MAEDLERLTVILEASTRSYERALAKAQGTTVTALKRIEKEAAASKVKVDQALGKIDTGNLSAQLNDIAVSLASGQSPFTVMLQQGAQISQIFGPGTGVKGVLAGVGGALASLVNPANLVLFTILGLGAAAATYFLDTKTEAQKIDEVLKRHSDLISAIRDRYGDAIQGVREYAKESQLVLSVLAQANAKRIQNQLAESSRSLAAGLQKSFAGVGVDLNTGKALGGMSDEYRALTDAAVAFNQSVKAGNPDVAEFRERLAQIASTTSDQKLREFATSMLDSSDNANKLASALAAAQGNISAIGQVAIGARQQVSEFGGALRELSGIALIPKMDTEKAAEAYRKALDSALDVNDVRAAANEYEAALKRIKTLSDRDNAIRASSRREPASAYMREVEALNEKIASLEVEAQTIGMSIAEREKLLTLQELEAAALKDKKVLTDAEIADNLRRAETIGLLRQRYDEAQKAQQEMIQRMDAIRSTAGSTLGTFLNDIAAGTSAMEALRSAVDSVRSALINAFANNLIAMLLGPTGTAGTGIFSTLFGGGRAAGGPMVPGRRYRVGENGPETVIPLTRSRVEPISPPTRQSAFVGAPITYAPVVDLRGADAAAVARLEIENRRMAQELRTIAGAGRAQKRGMRP